MRTCYFIPYSGHMGQEITTVRFDGDWGDEDKSAGVVVTIDSVEVHIGAKKRMVELHDSLFRLSVEYKEMLARRELQGNYE
ncbi:hypothetical protein ACO0K9_11855 [Undibacterium sp. Ji50W]|uniref:hypothetical protein n=1 Tax=Undibacterium sp. Ji50W TaxID=3413041 RepID=UPI003BEFFAA2